MAASGWKFWIDRGGTFTDVIGCAPDGSLHTLKLLSEDPDQYPDAAAEGIRRLLGATGPARVDEIRMGTTVATNALLERRGAATGLLVTQGFRDVLTIGNQNRPDIFDLHIRRPAPLYAQVAEVSERIDADGNILTSLNEAALAQTLAAWRTAGIESVAICFMHAWRNPVHEQRALALAAAAGFTRCSASFEVSPLRKYVARTSTTVADAYLSPVLLHYVDTFKTALADHGIECPRILFMQSNGGLVSAERFRGKDSVLSGPAGGVVAMGAAAIHAGHDQLIGFDMGGTSTDVSLYAGTPEVANETEVEGILLRSPMVRIHTIAAGGGSELRFADGRLQAGPESAGASPGPLSYGRGGPLTITDANVMLGRLQAEHFPQVFGPDGCQPLDIAGVRTAFAELAATLAEAGFNYTPEQTAAGFLEVAIDNMANAIRKVSVQRGLDPGEFMLCSFGGAGGQHACAVADRLGITRILLDPLAPLLSAYGMGVAPLRAYRQRAVNSELNERTLQEVAGLAQELEATCAEELAAQDVGNTTVSRWLYLKVRGSDTAISVRCDELELDTLRAAFLDMHRSRFGFVPAATALEIESLRVEAASGVATPAPTHVPAAAELCEPAGQTQTYLHGEWQAVPVYRRADCGAGTELDGPALLVEAHSTTVILPGWQAVMNPAGQFLLQRVTEPVRATTTGTMADPVQLEIFNNHFMHIAEQMGSVLRQTARSVNIKERLDFSCALFTSAGDLIANAPHVPVHLGSMDDSVKALLRDRAAELRAGDSFLANAPYNGGTHLPDITAISPVIDAAGELQFVVASRAHHADIGGSTPGSMPPHSRHIDEEGIVFDNLPVVHDGRLLAAELRAHLEAGEYPARNPDQNIADIQAQLAANERGRNLLLDMLMQQGAATVRAYTRHIRNNAEESVRRAIAELGEGKFEYAFDNDQRIRVEVRIDTARRSAVIDFTGTSPAADNNLNAPASVCQAAVMYVFRTLVRHAIPLNAGCRKPLELIIPPGCMLNPAWPAAVVGGNVETSQCVTDALYGALGVMAASQGTMNNLSFGNESLQYYETICGGAGAGPDFPGADAVQTHMTNSRMTDAEVLESRYPVIVREFSVRPDSGGAGHFRGGNGAIRKLEFRERMHAAILSNHRSVAPFGLAGGEPAQTGRNLIIRHDGRREEHAGIMMTEVQTGDMLVIETPGGGGYGRPQEKTDR